MGYILLQLVLALAMFVFTAVPGLASIKVTSRAKAAARGKTSLTLSLLSCFAGGVFLATCFLDILPHVNHNYEKFRKDANYNFDYAIPELLACIGFFAVYLLEEVCARLFSSQSSHHHVSGIPEEVALNNAQRNGALPYETPYTQHTTPNTAKKDGIFQSIILAVAMSFHSILEGLALGVQDSKSKIITLFISLILHKGIEAFSVGLQVCRGNMQRLKIVLITILIYSLMTPIGSVIGVSISHSNIDTIAKGGVVVLLEGLALGTFIYVTFLEVIAVERENEHSNLYQLVATLGGFVVIALFQLGEHFIEIHYP